MKHLKPARRLAAAFCPAASLRFAAPGTRWFAGMLLGSQLLLLPPVFAQSSTGEIYGQVSGASGGTVKIVNQDTGVTRTIPVNSQGRYSAAELPTGSYHVVLEKDGAEVGSQDVIVKPGVGVAVDLGAAGSDKAVKLAGVTVRGTSLNSIDTSSAQTSVNFSAKQLQQIPVGQNPVLVALLTPSASAGAPGLTADPLPSFGGSSVAENSYYINGFNVTNLFRNLSYATLPFEAIQNEQVLTGGYGPEYDLSTGGVINLTTKRGGNKWTAGASAYWDPAYLQGSRPDIYQRDGQLRRNFEGWTSHDTVSNEWLSGALIPNKLFIYLLASQTFATDVQQGYGLASPNGALATPATNQRTRSPFYLGKLDFNIDENNLLEFTHIEDKRTFKTQTFNNSYGADGHSVVIGDYLSGDVAKTGGRIDTLRYTANITPDLILTGQWGQLKYSRSDTFISAGGQRYSYNGVLTDLNQPGCPFVADDSANGANNDGNAVASTCSSGANLYVDGRGDTRTNWRADLEYKLELGFFGNHDLKAGYDHDNFQSKDGQTSEGGSSYDYLTVDTGGASTYDGQNYVEQQVFATSATARVITTGYYFKDNWKFADRWLAELGVRGDSFDNRNGSGQSYVKQTNILQPRIGLVWDVNGDSSSKAYAHYGIYSLPVTAGVAIRGASASLFYNQDFFYSGTDPVTGLPQNLQPTPANDPAGFYSTPYYLNGENGTTPNPGSVASQNLKPIQQSEYILGFQQNFAEDWIAGVRVIHRNLDKTIDDSCDLRPVAAYAQSQYGLTVGDNTAAGGPAPQGVPGCYIFNPGSSADLLLPLNSNDPTRLYPVHLSAADINEPKAKRVYDAVEFTVEKSFSHNWYFSGSYTWAHSYGNTEGLVRTDFRQTDTGTTVDFDFPEVQQGGYGLLANDHRHTLKLYGAYRPFSELTLGLNFLFQSGSPYGCLGTAVGPDVYGYANSYHSCGGRIVPEGSVGTTDDITQVDLSAEYRPHYVKGLKLSIAVFNLFDEHAVVSVYQFGESASGSSYANTRYAIPNYPVDPYQAPRSVRFGLQYDFSL